MIGFRPKPSALFLERPRLLRLLPEEPGYVVWLEAPYGYGKSVLTSQWASKLESDGWRVIWLALLEGDPQVALAGLLGLPDAAPWMTILNALSSVKTAVILEDLEQHPEIVMSLGPLLKHMPGLLLLASRRTLHSPELLRARSEGRLVHLTTSHLAFTADEAAHLFGDRDSGEAWERTRGWSLPLHMAALTGEMPSEDALWEGVRESLEASEWNEVLFLAALPYLPTNAADARAARLAELGFVQALENGYRLHPLAAEQFLKNQLDAIREVVKRESERLEPGWRCTAFERIGLLEDLGALLEDEVLMHFDPRAVLRWDALCQTPRGPKRWLAVSWARSVAGQFEAALEAFMEAAHHPEATVRQRLLAFGWALYDLVPRDLARAEVLMTEAQIWLPEAAPTARAVYLSNVGAAFSMAHDWARAEVLLEQACAIPEIERAADPRGVYANLMDARWQRTGALLSVVRSLEEAIELDRRGEGWFLPYNVAVRLLALGSLYEILEPDRALWCFTQLEAVAHHNPLDALRGAIRKASLLGQIERLAELSDAAQAWNEPGTTALARSRWARALRQAGRAEDALQALEGVFDASAMPERALCLNALNRDAQALEMLEAAVVSSQRMDQLESWAARYQITRDTADLEHLIHLTDARERVLPALVPLEVLPQTRPELSAPYPLVAVLRSGWKAAIQHRHGDIPALEVRVLGGFEVRVLGEVVTLTARPKDIVVLLALRLARERIAEALWPDADTDKSRNNLHVNLNALRKVVEPWGVPTYILESGLARANVDLWDLDHALATHDLNTVKRLYADLAPGFDLEVIEDTRANLRERTLEAMLEYATQSDPRTAEDTLEWVLSHDPTHETAFSRLLGLLVRSGRRVSAERRYREFARRLRDELGLEPAPETHRILSAV